MALIRLITLLSLLISHAVSAQTSQAPIDQDPAFVTILKRRIKYPVLAEQTGVYARVYARFIVDERGHVQQPALLQPVQTKDGFEKAVLTGLKHLPPLNPRYKGRYVLPVDFAYINYGSSTEELMVPTGMLPPSYLNDCVVLPPVRIVGTSRTYSPAGSTLPTPFNSPGRLFF